MYALVLGANSTASAASIPAYNFGTGDFTAVLMWRATSPGQLLSRVVPPTPAQIFYAIQGFDLELVGTRKFVGVQEFHTDQVTRWSVHTWPFDINDGECHYIGYVRNQARDVNRRYSRTFYLDGKECTGSVLSGDPTCNIDAAADIVLGGRALQCGAFNEMTDWPHGPEYSKDCFAGSIMNVGLWNRALSLKEIEQAAFMRTSRIQNGMVAYWSMEQTLDDASANKNPLRVSGTPTYQPCHDCVWTQDLGAYVFYQVTGGHSSQTSSIGTTKTINVAAGTTALYGALLGSAPDYAFPPNVTVRVTDPAGVTHNVATNTDTLFVHIEDGRLNSFIAINPKPGNWKIVIDSPANQPFTLQVQTLPGRDYATSIPDQLEPIFGSAPMGHGQRALMPTIAHIAVAGLAGLIGVAAVLLSGGTAIPAVVAGLAAFSSATTVQAAAVLEDVEEEDEFAETADKVASLAKLVTTQNKVLLVDPDVPNDLGTTIIAKWRRKKLRVDIMLSPFQEQEVKLEGARVTAVNLAAALAGNGISYVSASGHGLSTQLLGYLLPGTTAFEPILISDSIDPAKVRGKVFHFLACSTGADTSAGLGKALVQNGARAFIGYSDKYAVMESEAPLPDGQTIDELFVLCDIEVDNVLLHGGTVQDAVNAAKAKFNKTIDMLNRQNRQKAVEMMTRNLNLLVCYGDLNAKIL